MIIIVTRTNNICFVLWAKEKKDKIVLYTIVTSDKEWIEKVFNAVCKPSYSDNITLNGDIEW